MRRIAVKIYLWITATALAVFLAYLALQFAVDVFHIGKWRTANHIILGIRTFTTQQGLYGTLSVGEMHDGVPHYIGRIDVVDAREYHIGDRIDYFFFDRPLARQDPCGFVLNNPAQIPNWAKGIEDEIKALKK
jgi:hypothetical protein